MKVSLHNPKAGVIAARSPHLDWTRMVEVEVKKVADSSSYDLRTVLLDIDMTSPNLKILRLTSMTCKNADNFKILEAVASKKVFARLTELHLEEVAFRVPTLRKILQKRSVFTYLDKIRLKTQSRKNNMSLTFSST
jgi:hypothetical protein